MSITDGVILLFQAKRACLVTYDGEDIGTPCRGRFGVEGTCNATVACTLSIAGQDAALHFCERPPRPTGGFGSFGGNRQTADEASGNDQGQVGGRQFGSRRPFGRNQRSDDDATEDEQEQVGGRQLGNRQPLGNRNQGNGNFQRFSRRGGN